MGGLVQIFLFIGWLEAYYFNDGKWTMMTMFEDPKRVPGNVGFDPLNFGANTATRERLELQELTRGVLLQRRQLDDDRLRGHDPPDLCDRQTRLGLARGHVCCLNPQFVPFERLSPVWLRENVVGEGWADALLVQRGLSHTWCIDDIDAQVSSSNSQLR